MNHLIDPDGRALPLSSIPEWETVCAKILGAMQKVMGPVPPNERRCDLDPQVEEEVDCGAYVRQRITYASEPGSRTSAYLCLPSEVHAGQAERPAVLCLHPTDKTVGYGVVVGLGPRPNRSYASELTERGFVTLAPSYPHLADYYPDLKTLGYVSGTMKAIWDNIRALDLLESMPGVLSGEPARFGAIGHSLGGHSAVYTAAFDSRIQVIVSSCGLDSYLDYKDGDIAGWTQERYMPRIGDYALKDIPFDFHDIVASLAPRTCFINAPLHDSNFKWDSVDAISEAARRVYALYGAEDRLTVAHPDCAHDFPDAMREQAYTLLENQLM